jgi:DNA-binding Lrp family transcriptional regulator
VDDLDRSLLNLLQTAFPIEARPYLSLAHQTGVSEQEAWQRVQALREQGIIRRLGGVFDSHRLGYHSTLCAAKVPPDKIKELSELLQEISGVTHNYLRNHAYNMWFTLIAPSANEVEKILERVRAVLGTEEVYSLPATALFKINVDFDFSQDQKDAKIKDADRKEKLEDRLANQKQDAINFRMWCNGQKPEPHPVDEEDKALIRHLQGDLPGTLTPFADIAQELAWEEEEVLIRARRLKEAGLIRRFGSVLRHQKAGFTANAMGVWKVPDERSEEVGKIMAGFREVSHCYQRPALSDWPYTLFTMIHAQSTEGCREVMQKISQATGVKVFDMLYTQKELKKSSMQYFIED